ncbi:MAG TPA: hypothetical protein PKK00_10555 [Bacteroidales bacterium]|nr:hypothetical protein [Bacteroidales bacterium]HPS17764.1 hypothetical protein [Bacteroidales bacterium]
MRTVRILFIIIFASIIFTECKKEGPQGPTGPTGPQGATGYSTDPDPDLYGKWQIVSGLSETKYIILKNNNILYALDTVDYGFRSLRVDLAFITYAQIEVFMNLFNYTISNDTLVLSNQTETIVFKKNDNAPDETEWVTFVTVSDSIASPVTNGDGRQDIGFDGMNILWTAESNSNTLQKINPVTHAISSLTLSGTYYYGGVNFTNPDLYISNNNKIIKVNPSTGAVISTSPTITSGRIKALALVGQTMYCSADGYIYTWDISTNAVLQHFPFDADGMEYVGGYLYFFQDSQIHKCQLSPFKCIASYYVNHKIKTSYNGGITHDGANFWIASSDQSNQYYLYKINF